MRPLYETPETLRNEDSVIKRLCRQWQCESRKLPMSYRVDYALVVKEKMVAWLEVKCRNQPYEQMYLSLAKWAAGTGLSKATGLPFLLVYAFKDGLCWKRVDEDKPDFYIGGRSDRGDWQDMEPMAVFPLKDFKVIPIDSAADRGEDSF